MASEEQMQSQDCWNFCSQQIHDFFYHIMKEKKPGLLSYSLKLISVTSDILFKNTYMDS